MLDVVVLETAQDVDDRVDLADIAEELVAQSFALRRAAHQSRDIDEGELGRDDLLAARDRGELVEPVVGDRDIADVRSEEHTSELQSLMRISYAVFCLKKKKKLNNITQKDE